MACHTQNPDVEMNLPGTQIMDRLERNKTRMELPGRVYRWIKRQKSRRRKPSLKTKSVPKSDVNAYLDHTYEEIPDLIPAVWTGVRSESLPSFFLVATAGVGEDSFTIFQDNVGGVDESRKPADRNLHSNVSLSDSCSYETPQNCFSSITENQPNLELAPATACASTSVLSSETLFNKCGRTRLSCVRANCRHTDTIAEPKPAISKCPNVCFDSSFDEINHTREKQSSTSYHYCSLTEPALEKICDDIFSQLRTKRTFEATSTRRPPSAAGDSVYSTLSHRNKLLGGLMLKNHDRQMSANL